MVAPPKAEQLTIIVVSDRSHAIRRFRLDPRWLRWGAAAAFALTALWLGATAHHLSLLRTRSENRALADENALLRGQIRQVQDRVAHIATTLDRVERYDAKLRHAVAQLQDPDRGLAIGPVGSREGGPASPSAARAEAPALPSPLAALEAEATRQESSLRDLDRYFADQRSLLASTPSLWPTRGWVTSDFGVRLDPYTAERMMHRGLDIATPPGQPIYAPSDGTVVFAGNENGYGKVLVVDHGYGVRTRYGHLSEIAVKAGDTIRRGTRLGAVGSTGRSTGPHLHYEVRVNGIAENPRKFILE